MKKVTLRLSVAVLALLSLFALSNSMIADDDVHDYAQKKPTPRASTPTVLPGGTVGVAYTTTLATAIPSETSVTSTGTLPPGLTMTFANGTATLSGTPTAAGTYPFSITESRGTASRAQSLSFTVTIAGTTPPTPTPTPTPTTANLIPNPTLMLTPSTPNPEIPNLWNQGWWGSVEPTFTYLPSTCGTGNPGLEVTLATPSTGAAEWYPSPGSIPVLPNTQYTYANLYSSAVGTEFTVEFYSQNPNPPKTATPATAPTPFFLPLVSIPATTGSTCEPLMQTFTTPANATYASPFHTLSAAGSLTITKPSLTLTNGSTGGNTSPTAKLSISMHDNWSDQQANAVPIIDASGFNVTWNVIWDLAQDQMQLLYPTASNPLDEATSAQSVVYSNIYTNLTYQNFRITATITSTGPTEILAMYNNTDGASGSTVIGSLAAGNAVPANFDVTLPALQSGTPLKIVVETSDGGTLTVTNFMVYETLGHMDVAQLLPRLAKGDEIAPHTDDHCLLYLLYLNPASAEINPATNPTTAACTNTGPLSAPSTAQQQITGPITPMRNAGFIGPLDTMAYPYGSGAGVPGIETILQQAGYIVALGTNPGFNSKTMDPYNLNSNTVGPTTTLADLIASVQSLEAQGLWGDYAVHQVEVDAAALAANGDTYGTTVEVFQGFLTFLKQEVAAGRLIVDTVHNIATKYFLQ